MIGEKDLNTWVAHALNQKAGYGVIMCEKQQCRIVIFFILLSERKKLVNIRHQQTRETLPSGERGPFFSQF